MSKIETVKLVCCQKRYIHAYLFLMLYSKWVIGKDIETEVNIFDSVDAFSLHQKRNISGKGKNTWQSV